MAASAQETKRKSAFGDSDATVNEIIDSIIQDGAYSSEYNERYEKYLGGSTPSPLDSAGGLFDRSDEPRHFTPPSVMPGVPKASTAQPSELLGNASELRQTVEYEDEDNTPKSPENRTDWVIAQNMPPEYREVFARTEEEVQKPEFTSEGTVRYPAMGSGESEERVVFDADWEAKAKEDAEKRERYRKEKALRGDSAYARTFVTEGYSAKRRNANSFGYQPGFSMGKPSVNPDFIDPLSNLEETASQDGQVTGAGFRSRKRGREEGFDGSREEAGKPKGDIPFGGQDSSEMDKPQKAKFAKKPKKGRLGVSFQLPDDNIFEMIENGEASNGEDKPPKQPNATPDGERETIEEDTDDLFNDKEFDSFPPAMEEDEQKRQPASKAEKRRKKRKK